MMSDDYAEAAFRRRIEEEPYNATLRRIYADWLDESGRHADAFWERALAYVADVCWVRSLASDATPPLYKISIEIDRVDDVGFVATVIDAEDDSVLWITDPAFTPDGARRAALAWVERENLRRAAG